IGALRFVNRCAELDRIVGHARVHAIVICRDLFWLGKQKAAVKRRILIKCPRRRPAARKEVAERKERAVAARHDVLWTHEAAVLLYRKDSRFGESIAAIVRVRARDDPAM